MKNSKIVPSKTSNLLVYSFVLFVGLFYLYYPQLQNYSATPKWVYLAVFGLVVSIFRFKERMNWSLGMWLWLAFVLQYLVGCFASYNLWDSIIRSVPLILAPLVILLLMREENDWSVFFTKIAIAATILISPILLLTIAEIIGLAINGEYTHLSTYDFRYTFGNRNQYAELIALLVPLLATAIYFAEIRWKKVLFGAGIVLLYLTGTLLLNRAVLLVIYGVYPVGLLIFSLQRLKNPLRKYGFLSLAGAVLVGLILVASPMRKQIPVVKNLLETGYGSGSERVHIWQNSVDLWKEKPVFGSGSGDWKIEILRTPLKETQASESTVFYQRAHNDFIQIAVENGLVGWLLFVLFFVVGIVLLWKSEISIAVKILLVSGIVGYLLISNFSFPIEKVELLILLFLFLAPGLKPISNPKGQKAIQFGVLGVMIVLLLLSVNWLQMEKVYFLFKFENDTIALEEINKNQYTIDPTCTPLFWHEGNEDYNKADYEKALETYLVANKYNPYHVHILNNIGSCYYALNDKPKAEEYFKKALKINPNFLETQMNYSSFLFNSGDINGALDQILSIPPHNEPENYRMYVVAIAKAKYQSMIELYDEPEFENYLNATVNNDDFLYEISKKARISGRSYEMELREEMKGEKAE
jgi:O-antigen ligase